MGAIVPFNPLDKANLAGSIEVALTHTETQPLNCLEQFQGAGIYSLYYVGSFGAYSPLAKCNQLELVAPIYVGKAESKGKRKGGFLEASPTGTTLWSRLNDHARSIEQAENLEIDDFFCRYLVVDDLWISLGESLLISKYAPVWNVLVDGFGNHDPGIGRQSGRRPRWDTIHPGRLWANRLPPNQKTSEQICNEIQDYLRVRFSIVNGMSGDSYIYDDTNLV